MAKTRFKVAVIVAHPDDEVLWAGGTILLHPEWDCDLICLSRKDDADRSERFYQLARLMKTNGIMGNMDDGPDQHPLEEKMIAHIIEELLPAVVYDLIITHSPKGEYTRHLRHEETGKAVISLWHQRRLSASLLWLFAYQDSHGQCYPLAIRDADIYLKLPACTFRKKYNMMKDIYGFGNGSWELMTTPAAEAFWQFDDSKSAKIWLDNLRS